MEGDDLSEFLVTKRPKTYTNPKAKLAKIKADVVKGDKAGSAFKREPLTTKNAVKLLLEGTLKLKVCRYCLNIDSPLYEMDQVFQFGGQGTLYKVTIRDMVASFHPFKVVEDPNFPIKICEKCLDSTIQSYLFTQQCERASRALHNCFEDMYEKLDKLDPIERTKKRGRQKLNPNYNTLYADHENVINYADPIINIVNKGSEFIEETTNKITELECPRCWQVFTNIESLLNHEKIHPKYMWFSCRICGKSFPKRQHYRKHVKTTHNLSQDVTIPVTGFKCTECGEANETYDQHLQHIEKHKFHMVMEHLIERKMDKLCTVCLSKGINMVHLDKTVNMHGGCPELTGQRNLYNILGSTMPERQSHKYQELLIPHQANILTISKKQKSNLGGEKGNILVIDDKKYYFSLSEPVIISREMFDIDDYLFFFAKPIDIQGIKRVDANELENEREKNVSNEKKIENVKVQKDLMVEPLNVNGIENVEACSALPINESIHFGKTVPFTFSKPDYVADTDFAKSPQYPFSVVSENNNINWIFEKCEKNITVDENVGKVSIKEACNYCWMFKNTEKCEICKKTYDDECFDITNNKSNERINEDERINKAAISNNALIRNDSTTIIDTCKDCETCWMFKNIDKCYNCKKSSSKCELENDIKKGTNHDITEIIDKKNSILGNKTKPNIDHYDYGLKKWQCKFCLTTNGNNEKCYCCDSEFYNDSDKKSINITFGMSKSFLKEVKEGLPSYENKVNCDSNEDVTEGTILLNEKCDETPQDREVSTNVVKNMEMDKWDDNILNFKDNTVMDTEFGSFIEQNVLGINNKRVFQEEMDVEEFNYTIIADESNQTNNMPPQIPLSYPLTAIPSTSFNFHIGSGISEERGKTTRRFKRPIRRMATTFNK